MSTTTPGYQRRESGLIDRFGRRITYLRLSVTDRCNFRCLYCMDPGQSLLRHGALLTLEELHQVAEAFVDLGVRKIRLTGGEPLVRRGIPRLMQQITELPGLDELVVTTNGALLESMARPIREAGVRRVNISLDTLRPDRFHRITRSGDLAAVLRGIDAALAAGFERIKLNTVILKGRNHDEVLDLVSFAIAKGINISFIEEMPFGTIGDHDRAAAFYSGERVRAEIESHFALLPTTETSGGPARYFRIPGNETRVGFISPRSHDFCGDCNRVRVTAEGRLLLCLGRDHSLDLRNILRTQPGRLRSAIRAAMRAKPRGHGFQVDGKSVGTHRMNLIGG